MNDVRQTPKRAESGWLPPPLTPARPDGYGNDGEKIGIRELVFILWHGKWIIGAITVAVFVLALVYAFLAKPVYEANVLIQIEQQNQTQQNSPSDLLAMLAPNGAPADTEIQIMTSRSVLRPTVETEHLNIRVGGSGAFSSSHLSKEISVTQLQVPDEWMGKALRLTSNGGGRYTLESPTGLVLLHGTVGNPVTGDGDAVKITVSELALPAGKSVPVTRLYDQRVMSALQGHLKIAEQGKNTGIVQILLDGYSPVRIRDIANALANAYIKQNVTAMAAQAQQSLDFVNKQLPQLKQELDSAQSTFATYQSEHGVVALDQQAQALLQQLTMLESQLTQLQLSASAMHARYTENYSGYQGLQSQQAVLNGQIATIESKIKSLPTREKNYLSLLENVQVYQQLYTALLAKSQNLQVAAASTVGSARIVDYAVTPLSPFKPVKSLIGLIGLVIGVILGVLTVFLRRAFRSSVQDAIKLEKEFGVPVYAIVPHSSRQEFLIKRGKRMPEKGIEILAVDDPRDPAVESIRSLRTSLNFVLQDKPRKLIAIGGCTPGIGKSFLSVNISHIIGAGGSRTLLIDTDLRRGHLEQYMGNHSATGLSQVLRGELRPEDAIRPGPHHDNVDFLGTGPFPPNPYELLASPHLKTCVETLAERYDVIIMDLPPLLHVAEGLLIARLATVNLFVIKAGVNTLREIRMATDRMYQNGLKLDGFVFNDLGRESATHTYGRYAAKTYYYSRYENKASK